MKKLSILTIAILLCSARTNATTKLTIENRYGKNFMIMQSDWLRYDAGMQEWYSAREFLGNKRKFTIDYGRKKVKGSLTICLEPQLGKDPDPNEYLFTTDHGFPIKKNQKETIIIEKSDKKIGDLGTFIPTARIGASGKPVLFKVSKVFNRLLSVPRRHNKPKPPRHWVKMIKRRGQKR